VGIGLTLAGCEGNCVVDSIGLSLAGIASRKLGSPGQYFLIFPYSLSPSHANHVLYLVLSMCRVSVEELLIPALHL